MRTEKDLQGYFIKECKKAGMLAVKTVAVSRRGWPDVTVIDLNGTTHYVELKSPTGRGILGVHQIKTLATLRDLGASVSVIDSKVSADEFIAGS